MFCARSPQNRRSLNAARAGLALILATSVAHAAPAPGCSAAGGRSGQVVAVDKRLEIALDDGTVLRLAGIEPAQPTPEAGDLDAAAQAFLSRQLVGQAIVYRALTAEPDRWGRIAALADGPGGEGSLATSVVAAGFARMMPETAARACRADLLSAEKAARAAKKGLWGDPYYAVLAPDDAAGLTEHAGGNAIVEGKLSSVEAGPVRTRLAFGDARGGFSVTLLQKNVKNFEAARLSFRDLVGRRLRVRGLLDTRFGPQIEITNPDEIEVIDESEAPAGHAAATPPR